MDVHGVSWPATPVQAATGVIRASIEQGHESPAEIAQAEEDAGILFDPQRAEQIAVAAREQAAAEYRAELRQLREGSASLEWFRARLRAVIELCVGRPTADLIAVHEILTAADGRTPTTAPLTFTWNRTVMGPAGDEPGEETLVLCTTVRGGPATLVLDDEQRLALGGLLLASLHAAEACTTAGCGLTDAQLDISDPTVWGWIQVRVHGADGPARWWCSSWCVNSAITAAGVELAAADCMAAAGQAPMLSGGDVDEASCVGCGCTENTPCEGGCSWVPNRYMADLCSACAKPGGGVR
jgi:hypothetical protein